MSTFSELTRKEKRDMLRGEPFDGVQVTMVPKSIRDLLDTLASIPNNKLATTHPASDSLALIDGNWGVYTTSFPLLHLRQGEYMGTQIISAVELRSIDKRIKKNLGLVIAVDVVRYKESAISARKRKARFNGRRQSERENMKATEQAVGTDMPVRAEAMERVEKRLRKTRLPGKVQSDSEEEMLAPGERIE
ncbi:hypothetical protein J4E91_009601 [Alternaria rosae]|nr:hypothetical protein J4E91_009601 [Alternaria rosae]